MNFSRTTLSAFALVALVACGDKDGSQPPAQSPQPYAGQPGAYPQQGQPGAYPQQGQPGGYPQQGQPGGYPQQQPGAQPGGYPQQQPGAQPGGYPQQQPGAQPAPGGQPQQPGGLPFPIPGAPGGQAPSGGSSGGSAQAIDPNLAMVAAGPLGIYANSQAPGMAKEGPMLAGNFQEGQTLESGFTFQPGKCYTLVAAGVGIAELDLEMMYVTPVPGFAPSIGKDSTKGAQAVMGAKGNCLRPVSPFPAQAKFIVKATKGAGMAAAQLYVK